MSFRAFQPCELSARNFTRVRGVVCVAEVFASLALEAVGECGVTRTGTSRVGSIIEPVAGINPIDPMKRVVGVILGW